MTPKMKDKVFERLSAPNDAAGREPDKRLWLRSIVEDEIELEEGVKREAGREPVSWLREALKERDEREDHPERSVVGSVPLSPLLLISSENVFTVFKLVPESSEVGKEDVKALPERLS